MAIRRFAESEVGGRRAGTGAQASGSRRPLPKRGCALAQQAVQNAAEQDKLRIHFPVQFRTRRQRDLSEKVDRFRSFVLDQHRLGVVIDEGGEVGKGCKGGVECQRAGVGSATLRARGGSAIEDRVLRAGLAIKGNPDRARTHLTPAP